MPGPPVPEVTKDTTMTSSIGLAMLAVGILAVRGAYLFVRASSAEDSVARFLTGQVFAVVVTGLIAAGPILFASGIYSDWASAVTTTGLVADAVVVALFVGLWIGLGRHRRDQEPRPAGTVASIGALNAATSKAPKRRAA